MNKRIKVIQPEHVEEVASNLVVVAVAGMAAELGLKIYAERKLDSKEANIWWPEEEQAKLWELKYEVRAALHKRLDPVVVAKLLALFYGD